VAHRRAGVGHDEMRDDHMTVAKTQTLSG